MAYTYERFVGIVEASDCTDWYCVVKKAKGNWKPFQCTEGTLEWFSLKKKSKGDTNCTAKCKKVQQCFQWDFQAVGG